MNSETKNIIKVACIYITTIIGAGFASGQEIVQFFSSYYKGGFYGIILAGILFAAIGWIVLDKVYKERIKNYDEFLFPTVGWMWGWIMEIIITIFMITLFCIMNAGAGNIIMEKTGMPYLDSVALMSVICMIVILTDIKGVIALSTVVTPVLIIGILTIGVYILAFRDTTVFYGLGWIDNITGNWFFSALLYVSYNSILSVVIMCSLLPYLKTRKVAVVGGLLGGIMLCCIALILNFAILLFSPEALLSEFPVLKIVGNYGSLLSGIYTLVLWLAMLTSAVTSGYCFIDRIVSKIRISKKILVPFVCALAIPLSSMGFSNLIAALYPVFGYAGLFMVFVILFQGVKLKPILSFIKKNNK